MALLIPKLIEIFFFKQNIIAEHEIRNISCAAQDPEDLSTFAYITKDLKTNHHYCHVFTAFDVVSLQNILHLMVLCNSNTSLILLKHFQGIWWLMEGITCLPHKKTNLLWDSKRTFLEKSKDFLWNYLISHLK